MEPRPADASSATVTVVALDTTLAGVVARLIGAIPPRPEPLPRREIERN